MAKLDSATDRQQDIDERKEASESAEMRQRVNAVQRFRSRYASLMDRTGFGSKSSTIAILRWLEDFEVTDDKSEKSIYWREDFMEKDTVLREGESVMSEFESLMARAKPHISAQSYDKWYARLKDTSELSSGQSSFTIKKNWIRSELPGYVARWEKISNERDTFVKDPRFSDLIRLDPSYAILKNKHQFLELHYDKRKDLVAEARSTILASEKGQLDLHSKAKSKLESAVTAGFLSATKVGSWLHRTFKSNASPKKIEAFVNGTGNNSLTDLMLSWRAVKGRYDTVAKKFNERGSESGVRGFKLVSATQFLNMHYTQRLRYVEQAEDRMDDGKNIDNEAPVLLKIRHAMDMKDWEDAAGFITEAKMSQLSEKDWKRLKSMESYVTQFGKKPPEGPGANVMDAKKRLDGLVESIGSSHSELQPMILRLLKGPNANRSIHQLRWVVYNNLWCRTHGPPYLSDDIARKGSSKDQEQLTKYRAEQGLDVGRNDVLSYETADRAYFRKEEKARHKATYLQTNVKSGGVMSMVAEKMEREQDSKWLYWTTFCPHSDGDPKSEGWMRELMMHLTEMRSLTATIKKAGFAYGGPNSRLVTLN